MSSRQIEKEIDVCLSARIKADALGQTILSRLHTNRIVSLLMRKGEIK